jgi:hypothetical protein
MSSETCSRPAGWALIAGGLIFALGNVLHPLEHNDAAYQAASWEAAHLLIFLSLPLLALGLPELAVGLRRRGGGFFAPIALVLSGIGFIGMAPGLLAETYLAPMLGHEMMERIQTTGFGAVGGVLSLAWVVSSILLAVACYRARFGPRWVHALLVVVSVALLIVGGISGAVAGAVTIAATAAYGVAGAVLGWRLNATTNASRA